MTVDTKHLRELLEKATPGPWSAIGSAGYVQAGEGHPRHNILAVAYGHDGNHQINAPGARENGEYIAAANPATVSALLDEIERKDAEIARLREALADLIAHAAGCEALLHVEPTQTLLNARSALDHSQGEEHGNK